MQVISSLNGDEVTQGSRDDARTILDSVGINPEVIQERPGATPLMLIHDGGGTALAYRLLGNLGRTVLGVHSPGLHEGKGIVSIRDAADQYAALARTWLSQSAISPAKILVGGWSLGGTIALALAAAHPDLVSGVILLDPPPPGTSMTSDEVDRLIPSSKAQSSNFRALVNTQLKMNAFALSIDAGRQGGQQALTTSLKAPVYLISAVDPLNNAEMREMEAGDSGSCWPWMLSLNRASRSEEAWRAMLGDLLVGTQRVDGNHLSIFTYELAPSTTQAIEKATEVLESHPRVHRNGYTV